MDSDGAYSQGCHDDLSFARRVATIVVSLARDPEMLLHMVRALVEDERYLRKPESKRNAVQVTESPARTMVLMASSADLMARIEAQSWPHHASQRTCRILCRARTPFRRQEGVLVPALQRQERFLHVRCCRVRLTTYPAGL